MFLGRIYENYIAALKNLVPADHTTEIIKKHSDISIELARIIQDTIKDYLKGSPAKAYNRIDKAFQLLKSHVPHFIESKPAAEFAYDLYRMRVAGPEGSAFKKEDLFHIPFDKRQLVKRQRYSIPGLPSLYLGSTLYICWEELGRPQFDSLYMASFGIARNQHVTYLDFTSTPQDAARFFARLGISDGSERNEELFAPFAAIGTCWPLIAAASVRRMHPEAPFIAEYIIPQLILQWITENSGVDSVAYFSVSASRHSNSVSSPYVNFVFPVKTLLREGCCDTLRAKFVMTEPASWAIMERNPVDAHPRAKIRCGESELELIRHQKVLYKSTIFGKMEGELLKLPQQPLAPGPAAST